MSNQDNITEVLDSLPEKFWRVMGWDVRDNWAPVHVDIADRKRIVEGVLSVIDDFVKEHTDERLEETQRGLREAQD